MAVIKTSFTLRLNLIDHAKVRKIAEEENRSMTNMIETLVKEKIKSCSYQTQNGHYGGDHGNGYIIADYLKPCIVSVAQPDLVDNTLVLDCQPDFDTLAGIGIIKAGHNIGAWKMIGHPFESGACIALPQLSVNINVYIFDTCAEHKSHAVAYVAGKCIPYCDHRSRLVICF